MENFSERLRFIIESRRLTQSELASKLEISPQGLSNCLSGKNNPSYDFILKIIKTFSDINIYWLITGNGSPTNIESNQQSSKDKERLEELVSTQRDLILMYKKEIESLSYRTQTSGQ